MGSSKTNGQTLVGRPAAAQTLRQQQWSTRVMNSFWAPAAVMALIAAGVGPAVAQANQAPAAPEPETVIVHPGQAPAAESGDDIVCQIVPPTTGTRLGGGRECHKRREWIQRQQASQDLTRAQERTGFVWAPKGPGH